MKKIATSALAAMLAVGAAGHAAAQDMTVVRTAPQFDIGVSAGGAYSTSWFSIGGNSYKPGVAPIFGAEATFWLSPTFGLRANGQYMPSKLPQNGGNGYDGYVMNNWFYGLDLMWRPMFWSSNGGLLSSMYVFLGGGGLTTNIAGDSPSHCLTNATFLANGVCLPVTPTRATVGQGEAGLGFDLFPLGPLGIFLEGGVHGYDSPAHLSANAAKAVDKFAFTPYAVLGLKLGFGNIIPPPPPPPPPPPAVIPPPPPPEAPPVAPSTQEISVCVLQNGQLSSVTATYNPATGDTTGVPAVTEGYAVNAPWFINNEPVTFNSRRYVKYGLPRVLGVSEVTSVGTFQGVPVFAETSANAQNPEVIYVPVRTGCEFQPYQVEVKAGAVRG